MMTSNACTAKLKPPLLKTMNFGGFNPCHQFAFQYVSPIACTLLKVEFIEWRALKSID